MLITSSPITSLTLRSNAEQMPSIIGENSLRLWVFPLPFQILHDLEKNELPSTEENFCKIMDKVVVKINDKDIES